MRAAVLVACALAVAVAGCGSDEPPLEPRLTVIDTQVFRPSCTGACHSGGPDFAAGGLDLTTSLHATLVDGVATGAVCADGKVRRVVPGDPEASLLYTKVAAKIAGVEASCGDGMPAGVTRKAVPQEQADLIRAWIEAGAPDD